MMDENLFLQYLDHLIICFRKTLKKQIRCKRWKRKRIRVNQNILVIDATRYESNTIKLEIEEDVKNET